ncbi:MAG: hypothetical protein AB7N24_02280 [Dehalococcoidia bacterium]
MAAIALLGAVALAACGDDDDDGGNSTASANAEVLNAIAYIDAAGIHGINESITTDKTIPPTAKATADKVQTVLNITTWPKDLQPQAKALSAIFADMSASLEGDSPDLAKAGDASTKAHDGYHDFSHAVWDYLYEQGGVADPDAGHAD